LAPRIAARGDTPEHDAAVRLCRQYLAADDEDDRARLAAQLDAYSGDIEPVVRALATRSYPPVEAGYHAEERFQSAELRKKYPDDLLYFVVPKTYDPNRPTGLIVFMHGGGISTSRDEPKYTLRYPLSDSPPDTYRSGDMLAATGMITVGPSAPGKGESYYRWCLRASEAYLAAVIAECKDRFHIDPDRVFLLGHSMGGFGAYHHALRQPDRFAAIIACAGAWDCGYWPVIRGTPLCIVQGVHDAQRGVRWHHTDVEYARWTHRIFTRESLEHAYFEYDGEHSFAQMRPMVAEYLASAGQLRRDAYYPHVTLASPQGFAWNYRNPVKHNRWLTLDETTRGELEYDDLDASGDDFDSWRLEHTRISRRGAMIDAINRGNNRIDVTTENVAKLTVWLHPKMVDVSRPITVIVDGAVRFAGKVRPSLKTALESYERRADWGLIYPIKVELRTGR
jgi:pimeloyl-ACP methyl ester carboxylesterase